MLMESTAHFNNLSEKLREQITKRVESFGDTVRYRFKLAQDNPDPLKYNGTKVYPRQYTLDPAQFTIRDPFEDKKGVSKLKTIAIIKELDVNGKPIRFDKIKIFGNEKGILSLNLKDFEEDKAKAMMLELHPKHEGGDFADPNSYKIFSRIDEGKYAQEQRAIRTSRIKALTTAQEMSDAEIMQFNSGMSWEESPEMSVVRDNVERFAEEEPETFIKLTEGKDIEYRSVVQTALNKQKISFDPAEYKFVDNTTKQLITVLSPVSNKSHIELMASWLQTNGEKADKVYTRLKEYIK